MRSINLGKTLRGAAGAFLLAAGIVAAVPALATPPSHAPAHGWRKKHDPYYVGYTGRQWEEHYGILDGNCNREAIGTVLGGVVGGVVGSQVADGDDRAVELARDGQSVRWLNNTTGVTYVLTPSGGGQAAGSCRNFELQISRAGRTEVQPSRACRTGDGTWQMTK